MKKYLVKDEDEGLVVTELDEEPEKKTEDEDIEEEVHDDDALTPEEISALKSLAAVAPDLVALVEKSKTSDEEEIVDEDEEIVGMIGRKPAESTFWHSTQERTTKE